MLLALVRLVKLKRRRALAAVADVALLKGIIHWWKFTIVIQYPESIFWWILNFVGLLLFDDFDDASDNRYSCNLLENRLSLKSRAGPMTMAVLGESFACRYIEWCTWFVISIYTYTYLSAALKCRYWCQTIIWLACLFVSKQILYVQGSARSFWVKHRPVEMQVHPTAKSYQQRTEPWLFEDFFNLLLTDCWRYQQKIWTEPSARKRYKCFSD